MTYSLVSVSRIILCISLAVFAPLPSAAQDYQVGKTEWGYADLRGYFDGATLVVETRNFTTQIAVGLHNDYGFLY